MWKRSIMKYFGLVALGVALMLRFLLSMSPALLEAVWMQGWFPLVRQLQSLLRYLWLLPGYYLAAMGVLSWLWWRFPRNWRQATAWANFGRRLLNLLCGITASFLLLWGYNYLEPGVVKRMGLERGSEREFLADAYLEVMYEAEALRTLIPGIEQVESIEELKYKPRAQDVAQWVVQVLEPLHYPTGPKVRTRYIKPQGTLHRLSISGIYNPWTGEANVESSLGPVSSTFTTAHELAHAYGVSSEAEANFVAYMACAKYGDALGNYAAAYTLWRALGREVVKAYPQEVVLELASLIPEVLLTDREAIRKKQAKYQPYFPQASRAMNDTYLKSQGIKAGVADYDAFVELYFALRDAPQEAPTP